MAPPKSKSKGKKGNVENSVPKKEEVTPAEAQKEAEVTLVPELEHPVPEKETKAPEIVSENVAAVPEKIENGTVEVAEVATETVVVKPDESPVSNVPEVAAITKVAEDFALIEKEVEEESNQTPQEKCSTTDASDLLSVTDILKKLNLDNPDFTTEQKLNALCLIFKSTVSENVRLRDANLNLTDQMEKNEQTKVALQKLGHALRTQINLTKEEGELKVREETQRRIEVSENFQKTMDELGLLMTAHSKTNSKLKEENTLMSQQMHEILRQYEERQDKYSKLSQEHKLHMDLYEAKLNKAKLERAEMSTDFTRERLELHKSLVEAKEHIEILLKREDNMIEQIDLYKQQASELHAAMIEMGGAIGPDVAQNRNFAHFRTEIEKLTKRLKGMERDTADWKEKFEASNDQVRKMNAVTMDREKEIEIVKKKLAAMENLNRVLSKERNDLLQKAKTIKTSENGEAPKA